MSTDINENNEILPTISIEKELQKSYLDYAMSVIIGRALPDVRDVITSYSIHYTKLYEVAMLLVFGQPSPSASTDTRTMTWCQKTCGKKWAAMMCVKD